MEKLNALSFLNAPLFSPPSSVNVRSTTFPLYENTYPNPNGFWCCATGRYVQDVTGAHVFFKKWFNDRQKIGLHDIHDPKNVIPLFSPIEKVLDSGEVMIYYLADKDIFRIALLNNLLKDVPLDRTSK